MIVEINISAERKSIYNVIERFIEYVDDVKECYDCRDLFNIRI